MSHDDVIEGLRLYGGTLDRLADALALKPENREWLRQQRLAETADDRHARALCDWRLMKSELGIDDDRMRLAIVTDMHHGGNFTDRVGRILIRADVPSTIRDAAAAHERWIRESPTRLAKHLKQFK